MKPISPRTQNILTHAFAFLMGIGVFAIFGLVCIRLAPRNKLMELETVIESRFVGDIDKKKAEDAAAEALVDALGDRWSYYMTAEEYLTQQENSNNAYVGIGITISTTGDGRGYEILATTEGGGGAQAGLLAGDIVTAVDGQEVGAMDTNQIRSLVRGEEGSFVEVTVLRGEETLSFRVERRKYEITVASGKMVTETVGLVTIEDFNTRCAQEAIAAIESLMEQGAEKLVFDVRNNPGGYAHELTALLDYLLPEGEIFHAVYYNGKEDITESDASSLELPMAVLVNGSSYSAAEFFAAALQEYDAATVVGTQTCGKGYFQQTISLSDGSAVGLSVGKYYTPSGRNLQDIGVTPDIPVELDPEDESALAYDNLEPEQDAQLQAAIAAFAD